MIRNVDPFQGFGGFSMPNFCFHVFILLQLPAFLLYTAYKGGTVTAYSITFFLLFFIYYTLVKTMLNGSALTALVPVALIVVTMPSWFGLLASTANDFQDVGKLVSIVIILLLVGFFDLKNTIVDFKTLLLKKISENIKFYTPPSKDNFWLPEDPTKDTHYTSSGIMVDPRKDNIFVSVKKSKAANIKRAFSPIYHMSICLKLLRNTNDRQKYFHQFYGGLVLLNFIYFFSSLIFVLLLEKLHVVSGKHYLYILLAVISFILIGLWVTVHLFIKNIEIQQCKKSSIIQEINHITISDEISKQNVNEHYITLNADKQVNHISAIDEIERIGSDLIKKLDSIYQVVTPLLFLAQVSIAIAVLHNIFQCKG